MISPPAALTVDVESWCHASLEDFASLPPAEQRDGVLRGLDLILDLLERRRARATFFVLGSVAEGVPEILPRIRQGAHEIGSHGYFHRPIHHLAPDEFRADLRRSRAILREAMAYRSPMWSLYPARRWALEILASEDFRFDSSLFPIRGVGSPRLPRGPYEIRTRAGTLTEIPPLSIRGLCTRYPIGGTWGLRTFFYGDVRRAVRRARRRSAPAVFHIHPWELDPLRPPLRQPFLTRLALTVRFTSLLHRLDRLLGDFPFAPLTETLNGVPRLSFTPEGLP